MGQTNSNNDMKTYRDGYPHLPRDTTPNPHKSDNLKFFKGEIVSTPSGDFIHNIQTKWKGNYDRLEQHHGYIQWLFPIREHGMNSDSQKLEWFELVTIRDDPSLHSKLIGNYELMLDFYGMRLVNKKTGQVERNPDNYKKQYRNLNMYSHNYLRITRILKCLGELGYEHFKAPFLRLLIAEIFEHKLIPNAGDSCARYFIYTLRNKKERFEMVELLKKYGYPIEHSDTEKEKEENDEDEDEGDEDEDDEDDEDEKKTKENIRSVETGVKKLGIKEETK